MVTDRIRNAKLYYGLGADIEKALLFLSETPFSPDLHGNHAIDGDRIYYLVRDMHLKLPEEAEFEGHRKYIDIHYVADGHEVISWGGISDFNELRYDEAKDKADYSGTGTDVLLQKGSFMICYPEDIHKPCVSPDGEKGSLLKVVVKILISE